MYFSFLAIYNPSQLNVFPSIYAFLPFPPYFRGPPVTSLNLGL